MSRENVPSRLMLRALSLGQDDGSASGKVDKSCTPADLVGRYVIVAGERDGAKEPEARIKGTTVTFTNKTSDPDGDAFTSHWDFGDGSQSSAATPTHTYTSAGAFHVTLVVTDARGLSSSPKRDITSRVKPVASARPSFACNASRIACRPRS